MGKCRTCNFAVSFLSSRTRSQFYSPGFVYFSPSTINSVTHEGIGENSLRTVSGLKKNAFSRELLHWICTERVICCFLSALDYHNNKTQTDMHFVHPIPFISHLSLSSGANYKQIGKKLLRTLSGAENSDFSLPKELPKPSHTKPRGYNFSWASSSFCSFV